MVIFLKLYTILEQIVQDFFGILHIFKLLIEYPLELLDIISEAFRLLCGLPFNKVTVECYNIDYTNVVIPIEVIYCESEAAECFEIIVTLEHDAIHNVTVFMET